MTTQPDDLLKTTKSGHMELSEEELKRVTGGKPDGDLSATVKIAITRLLKIK